MSGPFEKLVEDSIKKLLFKQGAKRFGKQLAKTAALAGTAAVVGSVASWASNRALSAADKKLNKKDDEKPSAPPLEESLSDEICPYCGGPGVLSSFFGNVQHVGQRVAIYNCRDCGARFKNISAAEKPEDPSVDFEVN